MKLFFPFAAGALAGLAPLLSAEDAPLGHWGFSPKTLRGDSLLPEIGSWEGKVIGSAALSPEAPTALEAGPAFRGILLGDESNSSALPAKSLTAEAWVRVDKPIKWGGLLGAIQDNGSYERGWLLGYGQNAFSFALASEGGKRLTYLNATIPYAPGHWYHLAGTYDGETLRIYLDGKPAGASTAQSGPVLYPPKNKTKFVLGAYLDDNERYPFTGRLESATLWNRALSAEEIEKRFAERKKTFPGIEPESAPLVTSDWPTYLHDNERAGRGAPLPPGELSLRWTHRFRLPPKPAWPPPAKQDFWNKKYDLKPRVTFDHAFHLVGAGSRLYLASSADDQVRALSLADGSLLWTSFAGGPVRFSPTLAEDGRILFGSDDGRVRCLRTSDGALLWKTLPEPIGSTLIPGNGRIIHQRPIRTDVLVDGKTAYFGAGLFPARGTYLFSLDVRDGRILDHERLSLSPQGHLSRKQGRLFVSTGRDLSGAYLQRLSRRRKPASIPAKVIPEKYPFAFVQAGDLRFAGGDGEVAVFDAGGDLLQTLPVTGKAHALAILNGRLLASTDAGVVHCFAPGPPSSIRLHEPPPPRKIPESLLLARQALKASQAAKGYCLVLGDSPKAAALAAGVARFSDLRVILSVIDTATAETRRRALAAAHLYGDQIVVHQREKADALPYADHLFNLALAPDHAASSPLPRDEILRVLQPADGVALLGENLLRALSKPALDGEGEWSHLYADPGNTSCSREQHVGADLSLRWFGRPGPERLIDRHHRTVSPLCKNGFLYVPGNERVFGVDAYNGAVLWEREVPDSRRIAAMRDCGSMAADDTHLHLAAGPRCLAIEARSGRIDRAHRLPAGTETNATSHEWGYLARIDDLLLGSSVKRGGIRRKYGNEGIRQTYWDNRPPVCSDILFALRNPTGETLWTHRPPEGGSIPNPSLAAAEGKLHFLQSPAPATNGRASYDDLLAQGKAALVTLDLATGKRLRSIPLPEKTGVQNLYLVAADGVLAMVNSRNAGTVRYDVRTYDAATGALLWERSHDTGYKPNGDHGEQDRHPVVLNGEIYVEPMVLNLRSGVPSPGHKMLARRRGCGSLSASAHALYFRASTPTAYLPSTKEIKPVTKVSRPGCWINAIPAAGLLLLPEASSGCTCAYPVQASIAFGPATSAP